MDRVDMALNDLGNAASGLSPEELRELADNLEDFAMQYRMIADEKEWRTTKTNDRLTEVRGYPIGLLSMKTWVPYR